MKGLKLSRVLTYVGAVLMALWILVPIWLIAVSAFSTRQGIFDFPKALLPNPFSADTMSFFLGATNVLPSAGRSVVVAIITIVISTLIGAPACSYCPART